MAEDKEEKEETEEEKKVSTRGDPIVKIH